MLNIWQGMVGGVKVRVLLGAANGVATVALLQVLRHVHDARELDELEVAEDELLDCALDDELDDVATEEELELLDVTLDDELLEDEVDAVGS